MFLETSEDIINRRSAKFTGIDYDPEEYNWKKYGIRNKIQFSELFYGEYDEDAEDMINNVLEGCDKHKKNKISNKSQKNKYHKPLYEKEKNPYINKEYYEIYEKITTNLCIINPGVFDNLKPIIKKFLSINKCIILKKYFNNFPNITKKNAKLLYEYAEMIKMVINKGDIILSSNKENSQQFPFCSKNDDNNLLINYKNIFEYKTYCFENINGILMSGRDHASKLKHFDLSKYQTAIFNAQLDLCGHPMYHFFNLIKNKTLYTKKYLMNDREREKFNDFKNKILIFWLSNMTIFNEINAGIRKNLPMSLYIAFYLSAEMIQEFVSSHVLKWN
jgi:hypothetical protein